MSIVSELKAYQEARRATRSKPLQEAGKSSTPTPQQMDDAKREFSHYFHLLKDRMSRMEHAFNSHNWPSLLLELDEVKDISVPGLVSYAKTLAGVK